MFRKANDLTCESPSRSFGFKNSSISVLSPSKPLLQPLPASSPLADITISSTNNSLCNSSLVSSLAGVDVNSACGPVKAPTATGVDAVYEFEAPRYVFSSYLSFIYNCLTLL